MKNNNFTYINNPNYKIGIKNLTKEQLQAGLPSYDTLEDKINKIRIESIHAERKLLTSEPFQSMKYDNIFSILGGRGAGKTSVLISIYDELKKDNRNIMLPIIMPELIDNEENLINWLISSIEKNLVQLENNIKYNVSNKKNTVLSQMCSDYRFYERCTFNNDNVLRTKFNTLKNSYYHKLYECKNSKDDFSTIAELKAQSVNCSFDLIGQFVEYWNSLVDAYSSFLYSLDNPNESISSMKPDQRYQPLIFIFIDDADLKPEIIHELLFIIPKYLSHPNVVVFVSASQKTLSYVVKNQMYYAITQNRFDLPALMDIEYKYNYSDSTIEDKTIKFHDLRYGREYDKIKRLSDEILRKLFPVYNRYYLKKYDQYQEKCQLKVFSDETSNCIETISLKERLKEIIKAYYDNIIRLHRERYNLYNEGSEPRDETIASKKRNFKILILENNTLKINTYYFSFLGRYPRDIMSVYYALEEMLKELEEVLIVFYRNNRAIRLENIMPLSLTEQIHDIVIKFLNAAISSNRNLSMFSRHIHDLIKRQLLHWQLYVDYAKILEIFKDEQYYDINKQNPDAFYEAFCLLNFVEQIIVLIMPQRQSSHGYMEFDELLKECNIKIIKNIGKDTDIRFKQYYTFHSLNIIPNFDSKRPEHQNNFINGILSLNLLNVSDIIVDSQKNQSWYDTLLNTIFWRYDPISRIQGYKSELIILKFEEFAGELYNDLSISYWNYFLKALTGEKSVEDTPSIKNEDAFIKNVDLLISALYQLDLKFVSNDEKNKYIELFDLGSQLDFIDDEDDKDIKRIVANINEYIISNSTFNRMDFINKLKFLEYTIEKNNSDYLYLKNWYRNYRLLLQNRILLDDTKTTYKTYKALIRCLKSNYRKYINFYVNSIKETIKTETSSLSFNFNDVKNNLIVKYNIIQDREWKNLLKKV